MCSTEGKIDLDKMGSWTENITLKPSKKNCYQQCYYLFPFNKVKNRFLEDRSDMAFGLKKIIYNSIKSRSLMLVKEY